MTKTITWVREQDSLALSTGEYIALNGRTEAEAFLSEVTHVVVDDLKNALFAIASKISHRVSGEVSLSVWSIDGRDPESIRDKNVRLDTFSIFQEWGLVQEVDITNPRITNTGDIRTMLAPTFSTYSCDLIEASYHERGGHPEGSSPYVHLVLTTPDGDLIGNRIALAGSIRLLLSQDNALPSSPFGAYAAFLAGAIPAVLGQPESTWLEAKAKGYGLDNDRQKHELACDLTAMANVESGGVILIGISTRRDAAHQDILSLASGCAPGDLKSEQYSEVAKNKIVPVIQGLEIRVVAYQNRHFMVIYVPAQPAHLQPFIVKGGVISGNRWTGSAFTINNRIGSSKWALSAEAIHSLITAGRINLTNRPESYSDSNDAHG